MRMHVLRMYILVHVRNINLNTCMYVYRYDVVLTGFMSSDS